MNLQNLIEKQKELNRKIFNKFNISSEKEVCNEIYLSLKVELAELANEISCFKYWKQNKRLNRDKILEELVDVLHFILSIIILNEMEDMNYWFERVKHSSKEENLTTTLNKMYRVINTIENHGNPTTISSINELYNLFCDLCDSLNLSEEEVYLKYIEKNKVNHERQETGY